VRSHNAGYVRCVCVPISNRERLPAYDAYTHTLLVLCVCLSVSVDCAPTCLQVVKPSGDGSEVEGGSSKGLWMKARQRSAFPPNYIHSIDSTHMMMTALECAQQGVCLGGGGRQDKSEQRQDKEAQGGCLDCVLCCASTGPYCVLCCASNGSLLGMTALCSGQRGLRVCGADLCACTAPPCCCRRSLCRHFVCWRARQLLDTRGQCAADECCAAGQVHTAAQQHGEGGQRCCW
jgi:hypothetical protein